MNTPEMLSGGLRCLSIRKSGRNSGGKLPYGNISRIVNGFTRRTGRIYRRTQTMNERISRETVIREVMKWQLLIAGAVDAAIRGQKPISDTWSCPASRKKGGTEIKDIKTGHEIRAPTGDVPPKPIQLNTAEPQNLRGVGRPPFIQGGFFMRRRPYADRLLSACRTAADAAERILHGIF